VRRTSAHVVAVIATAMVVGDEPGVRFGLELADGGEMPAVEGGAPALLSRRKVDRTHQDRRNGSTNPLAHSGACLLNHPEV
jgi:hypothetical protein